MRLTLGLPLALVSLAAAPLLLADEAPAPASVAVELVATVKPTTMAKSISELPLAPAWQPGDPIKEIPRRSTRVPAYVPPGPPEPVRDPLLAVQEKADAERAAEAAEPDAFGTPILNFAGGGFTSVNPPDTVGDVGPNHYVQIINAGGGAQIRIYSKAGALLAGPVQLDSLAASSPCNDGLGDGVVLYDQWADRWWLTEFSGTGNNLCFYVSNTNDPVSSTWTLYAVSTTDFPDYPHYGLGLDALFFSTNESVPRAYAMDRRAMLAALPATKVVFSAPPLSGFGFQALTPVDADGIVPPPPGAPGIFLRHVDTEAHGSPGAQDRLEMFQLTPNFVTPASSTFVGPININITEFDSNLCGLVSFSCVPQPSGVNALDPLREVVMHRAQYRNFRRYQSIVGSLVTDASGSDRAGVRWFELRNTGTGWTLRQEGTYSPDTTSRWMSSVALDGAGDMALGYSVSSSSVFPGVRYVGRTAGATLGTLDQAEATIVAGSASNGSNRWGDYASLNVDPADECTFWFTTEYNASSGWSTRVASFKFDTCRPFVKGDLNGDLKPDLILRNNVTAAHEVWLMDGTTRSSTGSLSPSPASNMLISGVDDFNGDNRNDLVLIDATTGAGEFWLMNGLTRVGSAVPFTGATTPWKLSATADFNRDGQADLVWRNFSTQKIALWLMNGTTFASAAAPVPDQAVDSNWEIVATLDYNGDGYVDFMWYNPNSGKIVAWFLDASYVRTSGNFTTPANAGDNNWKVLASADYGIGADGPDAAAPVPGSHDLVWRNATSGKFVVWNLDYARNRTNGLFTTPDAPTAPATNWTIVGPR